MATDLDEILEQADAALRRSAELVEHATGVRPPPPELGDEDRAALWSRPPIAIQRTSSNRKLSPQGATLASNGRVRNTPLGPFVVTTYASIEATCPDSCSWKGAGCYAQTGITSGHVRNLDAEEPPGLAVSMLEADELDSLWKRGIPQDGARGGRDLRLHVSGDVSCEDGARALARMAERWAARGGGAVWTYTHRWREIPREAFGPIAVLASCDTAAEVPVAIARGYAPALVVPEFTSARAGELEGVRMIPCPAEAGSRTCVQCRLCLDPRLAARNAGILFAFHGPSNAVRKHLPIIEDHA